MSDPLIAEMKANINQIMDVKAMAIHRLTSERQLLVDLFQKIGSREFQFVLHVAAVMGFVLGVVQLALFCAFKDGGYLA